jgi:hypothetical protein
MKWMELGEEDLETYRDEVLDSEDSGQKQLISLLYVRSFKARPEPSTGFDHTTG